MKQQSPQEQLQAYQRERQQIADELQNEVNQTLASVLLWIQFAKKENDALNDTALMNAESNLKAAIDRMRKLHYMLNKDFDANP